MKDEPIYVWCDRVGRDLAAVFGDQPIPIPDIEAEVVARSTWKLKSVLVTDRCYNRNNDGIKHTTPRMFEYLGEGEVRYLGLNYPYNGPMIHKPKGEPERVVGQWINGQLDYTG